MRFEVEFGGRREKHYANMFDGDLVDVTYSQFPDDATYRLSHPDLAGFSSVRERLLSNQDTAKLYRYLKAKVEAYLGS